MVKPDIGNIIPASVTCSIEIDLLGCAVQLKNEWEDVSQSDGMNIYHNYLLSLPLIIMMNFITVVFLITIQNPSPEVGQTNNNNNDNNNESNNLLTNRANEADNQHNFLQKYGE